MAVYAQKHYCWDNQLGHREPLVHSVDAWAPPTKRARQRNAFGGHGRRREQGTPGLLSGAVNRDDTPMVGLFTTIFMMELQPRSSGFALGGTTTWLLSDDQPLPLTRRLPPRDPPLPVTVPAAPASLTPPTSPPRSSPSGDECGAPAPAPLGVSKGRGEVWFRAEVARAAGGGGGGAAGVPLPCARFESTVMERI
jgi:hypothetical protein